MISQLKKHQPSITIEEQIQNLKDLGLIVKDDDYARTVLNDISYFRLVKAYSLNLKPKNGNYIADVTFEHLVELYLFNANLRQLIFPQVEKIEVNARCRIANFVSNKYGVLGYLERNNFVDEDFYNQFLEDIDEELRRNARAPFVKNFKENYEGGQLPMYALVEICSFGTLSKFYKNMKNEDKKEIAKSYGVGYTYYQSWIEAIAYVRNICAHYGRLYNAKLTKRPTIYKQYSDIGIINNKLFAVLLCMRYLLKNDIHWNRFVEDMDCLINKYQNIEIESMGFTRDWKQLLKV